MNPKNFPPPSNFNTHDPGEAWKTRFLDGCHRYGWLINLVVMFIMFAYFLGGVNDRIGTLSSDVNMLKAQVFDLAHITRGLKQ